ncbi:MAG: winged helix-turn-helix domain-containing protein [Candidatus Korarchaeota archaeon]|nr:helix-turn-helix transcriptional regulator [Thermoproteota archaeon]MCR8463461.1 helix-turn-helix transcriptional regulator [Thermoproteota archaeon]MCR8470876.1 helix-turn-helix transcriptional regulator [Thermoproteota archaeon]MCR8473237.1 helix-turn-helix transcriptional regulator [Thermoproteota archaeon]
MSSTHRSRIGILLNILEAINKRDYAIITEIIREANIPHERLLPILERLIERGYIRYIKRDNRRYYMLTPDGYRLMQELRRLKHLIEDLGLSL